MITRFCYPSKTAMLRSAHVLLNRQYHAASFDFPPAPPLSRIRLFTMVRNRPAKPRRRDRRILRVEVRSGGGYSRMGLLMTGVCQVPARHASAQVTLSTGDEGGDGEGEPQKTRRKPARLHTIGAVISRLAKMAALQTMCIYLHLSIPYLAALYQISSLNTTLSLYPTLSHDTN